MAKSDRSGRTHRADRGHADAWSDALQRLIGTGHAYADILGYTLAQLNAFLGAVDRQESRQLANHLTVISVGAQGSSESIKALLRGIDA